MNLTAELIALARELSRPLQVEYADQTFKYLVSINNVVHKDKHLRRSIHGAGFTIELACEDYLKKCWNGQLENWLTNKVIEVKKYVAA